MVEISTDDIQNKKKLAKGTIDSAPYCIHRRHEESGA
jgi:hypothetical protein